RCFVPLAAALARADSSLPSRPGVSGAQSTKNHMLVQIEANSRDRSISVIDFPMDGTPSEGCSTTTVLAQLFIERDAGAGAVHTITLNSIPSRVVQVLL